MVFLTLQIYTYHIFQHSLFLSQQLNINKIRHSEKFCTINYISNNCTITML